MKHIKNFGDFILEYKSHYTGIGSMLTPVVSLFSGLSTVYRKGRMKILAMNYSSYLNEVYQNYIKENPNDNPEVKINPIKKTASPKLNTEAPKEETFIKHNEPISSDKAIKDEEDFTSNNLDIDEIEGLLYHSKSPQEVLSHQAKLRQLETQAEKEIDTLFDQMNSGDNSEAEEISNKINLKKARLNRIQKLLKIKPKLQVNENIFGDDWRANAVEPPEWWNEKDRKSITNMINPYKIEEILLKKEGYCISDDDRKAQKLKNYWQQLQTSIFKKWNYVFLVESLTAKNKIVEEKAKKEEAKVEVTKVAALDVLESSFPLKDDVKVPNAVDGKYYFLSLLKQDFNLVLLKVGIPNDKENYNMYKVVGVLRLADGASERNIKWTMDAVTNDSKEKQVPFQLSVDSDGYSCVKLLTDANDLDILFSSEKENSIKNIRHIEGYKFYQLEDSKEIINMISRLNFKTPNPSIGEEVKKRFAIVTKNKK